MNKERYNQIIDEVYDNYKKEIIRQREAQKNHVEKLRSQGKRLKVTRIELLTKDEFINKCKIDTEFSERWGLTIEERELSTQERNEWFQIHLNGNNPFMKSDWKDFELDQQNIPTKQITLEYNNEKTYYYE